MVLPDCSPSDCTPGGISYTEISAPTIPVSTAPATALPGVTPRGTGVVGPRDARCEEVSDALHRWKCGKEGSDYYFADGKLYDREGKYLGEAFVTMSKDGPCRAEELAALKNADHVPRVG